MSKSIKLLLLCKFEPRPISTQLDMCANLQAICTK